MNQFVFLYPIPEYINSEIERGYSGYKCPSWTKRWGRIFNELSEEEKIKLRLKAIKELQSRFSQPYSRKLNKSIQKRYRDNGFKINWVIFKGHNISELIDIQSQDCILETDICFKTHTTKREDGEYPYPDINLVLNQLGEIEHLRLAGFHMWDCIDKFARCAYEKGLNVLVDEDLTDFFCGRIQSSSFRTDKYPTYNPREFDTKTDSHFFETFMEARIDRPWLWQNY